MSASAQLTDVFAKRTPLPTPRRSFVSSNSNTSTSSSNAQEKCTGCREALAKLATSQNVSLQLRNKLAELKRELELARRKHTEINNDIIRANDWPLLLRTVQEQQVRVKSLVHERDDLLRKAAKREKEIVALKAENSAIKSVNEDVMERLDRRLLPQPDARELKARRYVANSSPLLHDLQARSAIYSPAAFPVTNADLIEPLKSSDRKSLLARYQLASRETAKRTDEIADIEHEDQVTPSRSHSPKHSEAPSDDEEANEDPDAALRRWHQSWANFFDEGNVAITAAVAKRKIGGGEAPPLRAKRVKREWDTTDSSSESEDSRRTPRPSRSAKNKITNLREPRLGGKLRAGYPGTFDLDGAVPHWRERDALSKPSRKTPVKTYAELSQSTTPKTPLNSQAKVRTPRTQATPKRTPPQAPKRKKASDVEVEDEDGFRYFTKTPVAVKFKRLSSRQPAFWDGSA